MKKRKILLSACTAFIFLYLFSTFNSCQPSENKTSDNATETVAGTDPFVGDKVCGSCHNQEYADWKISDHYQSMLPATDSSVLGDFNNASFSADGITSRFFKRGNQFIINTEGSNGAPQDYIIKYTFGHYPLQQYLIEFPGGRMQVTRQCWDSKNKKWFHQYPDQKIPSHDWLHWTNRGQNWNANCASCHSTNLKTNYLADADSFHTTWSVVNVSCESCHGAGRKHIEYVSSPDFKEGKKTKGSLLAFHSGQSSQEQVNTCAPCHSRRFSIDDATAVTSGLLNHYIPESPHHPAYHKDGQILEEDYEYSSFLQSKMFQHDVKCSNCHNPHSGKLLFIGNALCTNCHDKSFDVPAHTMHAINSEGAQCVNCHAPGKYYMGNDFRLDHSFRIPRPDLTVKYGTPNACNNCHTDKKAKWAAEEIVKKFGAKRKYNFSEDLIPGSMGMFSSSSHLQKLSSPDTNVPAIIRAVSFYYMSFASSPANLPFLLKGLKDEDALVRYEALVSLKFYPSEQWKAEATLLLRDPVKAVRIAAADLFLASASELNGAELNSYNSARTELFNFLLRNSSGPQGRMRLADAESRAKDYFNAEKNYLVALKMDSLLPEARLNLASMYAAMGEKGKAMKQLETAFNINPENEQVNYFLALLHVEMEDYPAAQKYFKRTVAVTDRPKVFYNYGLLLERMKLDKEAESIYRKGLAVDPNDLDLNYVTALYYYNRNRKKESLNYFYKLTQLLPGNAEYMGIYNQVKNEMK